MAASRQGKLKGANERINAYFDGVEAQVQLLGPETLTALKQVTSDPAKFEEFLKALLQELGVSTAVSAAIGCAAGLLGVPAAYLAVSGS
jgi:hypothetical protein